MGALYRFAISNILLVTEPFPLPKSSKFPEIKTYIGQGIDDPTATVRFDWTPAGFHAQILSANGTVYIDPYSRDDIDYYISYDKSDYESPNGSPFKEVTSFSTIPSFSSHSNRTDDVAAAMAPNQAGGVQVPVGTQLRTYRLAMASNGEHTQIVGGTAAAAMSTIATVVNRINGIYETEVAVRFVLVNNNNLLIYTNPATDPYTNNDTEKLLEENQTNIDSVIGTSNYDIGHVLTTASDGGLAGLGVVCNASNKAEGESGAGADSVGDPFYVDFIAHEIGHQFNATHIFNSGGSECVGSREGSSAYEPGSGSTIMSYAGVCGTDNIQPHNDPFFNAANFDQISAFVTTGGGSTCGSVTNTGNTPPVPNAGLGGFTIPKQTPFTLTGSATDIDGDTLTYSWEEHDLGDASTANDATNPPFFRSFPPRNSPSRTFPQWSDIINNTTTIGEILPNIATTLNFRLTARDNKPNGGGVNNASISFNVADTAGPFLVTAPNTEITWVPASTETVTWDVANTNLAPVSCANVNILLSTDGGATFPTTLASNVPNNGSASVTVPSVETTKARVQVACADNIFFDISNVDFLITTAIDVDDRMTRALGSYTYDSTESPPYAYWGTLSIDFDFTYNTNGGPPLNGLFVKVHTANEATLMNSDDGPAGVSAVKTIVDSDLPSGDSLFSPDETLTVPFVIGINNSPWGLNFDLYGVEQPVVAAGNNEDSAVEAVYLGTYVINQDTIRLIKDANTIYIPLMH